MDENYLKEYQEACKEFKKLQVFKEFARANYYNISVCITQNTWDFSTGLTEIKYHASITYERGCEQVGFREQYGANVGSIGELATEVIRRYLSYRGDLRHAWENHDASKPELSDGATSTKP